MKIVTTAEMSELERRAAEPGFHLSSNGKPRILHEHLGGKANRGSAALKLSHLGCGHDLQSFLLLLRQ